MSSRDGHADSGNLYLKKSPPSLIAGCLLSILTPKYAAGFKADSEAKASLRDTHKVEYSGFRIRLFDHL
jgi:hypothetical protein